MRNLLSANFHRLMINKAFWITAAFMIGIELLFVFPLIGQGMPMDHILFMSLQMIGLLSSIFLSSFIGTEYHDGTLRNKIIVGHKRNDIYISSFLIGCFAITIIYLAGVLTGCLIGFFLFEAPIFTLPQILLAALVGWLASISYVAIFNIIGMLSSSKARTSILCILTAFALAFIATISYGLYTNLPNAICQFLYEFIPFGQTIQVMPIKLFSPLRLIAYALLLTGSMNMIGLYVFNKKDLK